MNFQEIRAGTAVIDPPEPHAIWDGNSHVSCALRRTFIFSGPGRGSKAPLIFLMTALLKLSISHHSISFSLSSDLFYWMVTREPRCLKLMIHCLDLVFYLLKNISIAQNLWQYVGNIDGKNMTLISLSALFKKQPKALSSRKDQTSYAVCSISSEKVKKVGRWPGMGLVRLQGHWKGSNTVGAKLKARICPDIQANPYVLIFPSLIQRPIYIVALMNYNNGFAWYKSA